MQTTAEGNRKLAYRVQQQDESNTSYIDDVLALCNRADPKMTDEEKIRRYQGHSRRGVPDICRKKAQRLWLESQRSDELCKTTVSRIRLPSLLPSMQTCTAFLPATLSVDAIRSMVRDAVREDLGRCPLPLPD